MAEGRKYTREETEIAIAKGRALAEVMTASQREYLLGVLLAQYIVDGNWDLVNSLIGRVQKRTR